MEVRNIYTVGEQKRKDDEKNHKNPDQVHDWFFYGSRNAPSNQCCSSWSSGTLLIVKAGGIEWTRDQRFAHLVPTYLQYISVEHLESMNECVLKELSVGERGAIYIHE